MAQPGYKNSLIDVAEHFAGESSVGRSCVRRRFACAGNIGIVTGFGLTKEVHQKEAIRYLDLYKCVVVATGPPHVLDLGGGAI